MSSQLILFNIPLTLLAGGVFGGIFILLRIPNGLRIGAMTGAALLNVLFNAAYMPSPTKFMVQVIAGALIGCTMEKSDVKCLPQVVKPTFIMVGTFLALNLAAGFLIHLVSPVDLLTALLCAVPGGVTDIPIIAADMGADTPKVALAQLARYILGVGIFPPMIFAYDNLRLKMEERGKLPAAPEASISGGNGAAPEGILRRVKSTVKSPQAFACTLALALGAGFLGGLTGIPAGTFLFSTTAVLILRLCFDFAYLPPWVKKSALLISGCYIGGGISMEDVRGFRLLALPIIIIIAGYIINCFITGKILSRLCGFNRKEGMLTTTPAGASDIALSSADIGVENTGIIIIQIFRALIAMTVFPQIINLLVIIVTEGT
ncbi:MAG: AbrB family transcriptional regulator [Treponema sp.]|jgi:membrane AbrB-like protein|nr:AbrB family transcriptional regulator [Treponema sp.]